MRTEILLMLVAIGLGTYALRALPLIGARRLDPAGKVFRTLQLLGPTLAVQRRFGGFVAPILAGVAACALGLALLRSWGAGIW